MSVQRTSSRRKTKRLPLNSMPRNIRTMKPEMPSTSLGFLFQQATISTSPVLRSVLSTAVSSSRNRYSTGHIPTSKKQKPIGRAAIIHMLLSHEWLCSPIGCRTRFRMLPKTQSSMNSILMCSSVQKGLAQRQSSNMKTRSRNGSISSEEVIFLQVLMI